jgi:HSP20 family protein
MNAVTQTREPNAPSRQDAALWPPVDVIEDSTGITLYADLPGVPRDKLSLRVEGDTLWIEGEVSIDVPQGMEASHAEVQLARYRRSFTLSKELPRPSMRSRARSAWPSAESASAAGCSVINTNGGL